MYNQETPCEYIKVYPMVLFTLKKHNNFLRWAYMKSGLMTHHFNIVIPKEAKDDMNL